MLLILQSLTKPDNVILARQRKDVASKSFLTFFRIKQYCFACYRSSLLIFIKQNYTYFCDIMKSVFVLLTSWERGVPQGCGSCSALGDAVTSSSRKKMSTLNCPLLII